MIKIYLNIGKIKLDLSESPIIMAILNLSPESPVKSSIVNKREALSRAELLKSQGAKIIDVGGNSSSSKAPDISIQEEKERVLPIIETLVEENFIVSIDSWNPDTVKEAARIGVHIVNDINGLENSEMQKIVKENDLPVIIMHMRGRPKRHYDVNQTYEDITSEILQWFRDKINYLTSFGIKNDKLLIDPGFGFGKSMENNLILLKNLRKLALLNYPLVVSASRKSFIAETIGIGKVQKGEGLYEATMAIQLLAALNGANILRVHDVKGTFYMLQVYKNYLRL